MSRYVLLGCLKNLSVRVLFVKKSIAYIVLASLAISSLAACSSRGEEELATSMSDMPSEPSDADLARSISQYLQDRQGPNHSRYQYARLDLNGDGKRDALVLFNLPHNYWCGWSGCTLTIFEATDNNFTVLSETSRIRGPLVVGGTSTEGWHDIGVRVSGTGHAAHNVVLRYNGLGYPDNPLNEAPLPYDLAALGGTKIFP